MLASDIFNTKIDEVSQDWNERWRAGEQLADLFNKKYKKGNFTAQDVAQAQALVKITGRAHNVGRGGYRKYTAGNILDDIVEIVRNKDIAAGKTPELTRAPTTRQMAKQIAAITRGHTTWRNPTTWSTNFGDRYRDPADHVEYDDKAAYDAAWKFLSSKGKQVHYKEGGGLRTAIQIGSFLIEPSSRTMGYFSDNPETTHSISVRTVKSLGGRRQKQDISDEQAAKLQQIARNRNDAALTLLKIIFKTIGEKDAAETIANSEKLSPAEKAKLGKIVAKGQQGVAEGVELKFHTIELNESQIPSYVKKYFEAYNVERPHIKSASNIKQFGNKKLSESVESREIDPFIQMVKSVDTNETIKVGDYFAVLAFEIIFAWKEINATGFTTPKEVVDIKMHSDGTIKYIKFSDGDRYPRLTPATYQGKPVIQTAYFDKQTKAESALTALTLKVPAEWEFNNELSQGVSEGGIGKTHISPSGVKTNMPPSDDDYEINYGKQGLVAKDRRSRGVDVKTGTKKVAEESDPCWKGYRQIGTKKKNGKTVPNCVPKKK